MHHRPSIGDLANHLEGLLNGYLGGQFEDIDRKVGESRLLKCYEFEE